MRSISWCCFIVTLFSQPPEFKSDTQMAICSPVCPVPYAWNFLFSIKSFRTVFFDLQNHCKEGLSSIVALRSRSADDEEEHRPLYQKKMA